MSKLLHVQIQALDEDGKAIPGRYIQSVLSPAQIAEPDVMSFLLAEMNSSEVAARGTP